MKTQEKTDCISKTLQLAVPVKEAFENFVNRLSSWWPKEYSWAGNKLQTIGIEPKKDGKCYEIGPFNFRCDWGRVVQFDPPGKIIFTWQISPSRVPEPDPEKASEIEVTFVETSKSSTRVHFEHRNFSNHGDAADQYKKAMDSVQGWDYILKRYHDFASR